MSMICLSIQSWDVGSLREGLLGYLLPRELLDKKGGKLSGEILKFRELTLCAVDRICLLLQLINNFGTSKT